MRPPTTISRPSSYAIAHLPYTAAAPVGAQYGMTAKTHFSFELFYAAESATTQQQRDQVMQPLEQSLTALFAAIDAAASVAVSSSHKSAENQLVELVTVLQDDQIGKTLDAFCSQNGLVWEALE